MVLATGFFACNDALMKLATVGLPPFEVLFLRGFWASLLALPVVLLTGNGPQIRHIANRWVVLRNYLRVARGAVLRRGARQHADRRSHGARTDFADAVAAGRRGALSRQDRRYSHGADCDRLCRCGLRGAAGGQWRFAVRDPGGADRGGHGGARHHRAQGQSADPGAGRRLWHAGAGDDRCRARDAGGRALGDARCAASAAARRVRARCSASGTSSFS